MRIKKISEVVGQKVYTDSGDYFGEIALIKKVTRTRSVIAKDYCNLYVLEKKNFDRLLEKYPKFKKHIYETIKKREKKLSDSAI